MNSIETDHSKGLTVSVFCSHLGFLAMDLSFFQQLQEWWFSAISFLSFDPARLQEPEMIFRLLLQCLLLSMSGFFSGSEVALFSLSRLHLQNLRKSKHPQSNAIHALLDQPRRLIISILCGNELVNIAASANMAGVLTGLYADDEKVFLINISVMVPLLLLFGEVTPKTVAVNMPVPFSKIIAPLLSLWVKFVAPLRAVIRIVADRVTTLVVGEAKDARNILQVDEFRSLVEDVVEQGVLDSTERALIYHLLESGDTEIVEIMTPRTKMIFFDVNMSVPEMVAEFRKCQHPRIPVFQGHRDNLVGFIHAEDILQMVWSNQQIDFSAMKPHDIMRPPVVAPLTKKVDEMFDFFQEHKVRAAAVLNEFGGVEGFVTMDDVLTFIFGDISGDSKITGYQELEQNVYEMRGDMKLNDFNNLTNFGITDPRMTTIGGVAFRYLDRLPHEGDKVVIDDVTITILAMDGHRIAKIRVVKEITKEQSEGDEENAVNQKKGNIIESENSEYLENLPFAEEREITDISDEITDVSNEYQFESVVFEEGNSPVDPKESVQGEKGNKTVMNEKSVVDDREEKQV